MTAPAVPAPCAGIIRNTHPVFERVVNRGIYVRTSLLKIISGIALTANLLIAGNTTTLQYRATDTNILKPALGGTVLDNVFKTQITRINKRGSKYASYPKVQSWNKNMSLLRIGNRLYDADTLEGYKQVFALRLDGTGDMNVQNFSQTHISDSFYETYGAPSPDGRQVIFNSDWDNDAGVVDVFIAKAQKTVVDGFRAIIR